MRTTSLADTAIADFSLTSFICSCVQHKLTKFSLDRQPCSKAGHASFWTRKNLSIYLCTRHEQIKLVKENLVACTGVFKTTFEAITLHTLYIFLVKSVLPSIILARIIHNKILARIIHDKILVHYIFTLIDILESLYTANKTFKPCW